MKDFLSNRRLAIRNFQFVSLFAGFLLLWASPALAATLTQAPDSSPELVPADEAGTSANWAGYVAEGDTYTGVNGSWIVPRPDASTAPNVAADATWVGIGGVESHDLIQAGTQAIIQNGEIEYQAWYETLPHYQTQLPVEIHAGDSVSVSLSEVEDGDWLLTFVNNTTGKSYSTNIAYESSHSSAEWIEEMPVGATGRALLYLPLDDFGNVGFTNAGATANGSYKTLSQLDAQPLTMMMGEESLATPSVLGGDGASFAVSRSDTSFAQANNDEHMRSQEGRGWRHFEWGNGSFYISWEF